MKKFINWLSSIRYKVQGDKHCTEIDHCICYRYGDNPSVCPDGVRTKK